MAVASCVLYGAISLASVWQAEVQGMGESSRYAAQFIAASVAPEVAADDRPQLLERLHALQASSFVSTSCVYSATDEELVAAFGPSVCPTNAADRLDQHFYGSHLVRWEGQTVGQVIVFVPYTVARSKVAGFIPILAIPFLFAFAVALFVTRRLARQASQGITDIVQQLQSDEAAPISPSPALQAPKEVQQLAGAFNQRLSSLIDARNAAELQARQRESVEQAERRARQLIRNIIDLVPYIIYAQRTDGTLVFANLAAADLYDVPVEQLVSPAFLREHREDDGLVFSHDPQPRSEIVFGSKRRRLQITRVPFENRNARLVIAIDVTEAHRLQTQLQFSQRLEMVGTLAGGIAHDFNNLLTPILGYASLLVEQDLPADTLNKLRQIESAAEKARRVVQQMLAFSRQQPSEHQPVNLDALLHGVASLMRISVPATVRIVVESDGLPTVLADPTQLEQVLVNLCTNAAQAIGNVGGKIELRARMTESLAEDVALPAGRYANIEVVDTGPGIATDVMQHVFEPFFTTKEVGQGSGLGLSVAHGIVRNHGGELLVSNRPGAGAAFTILLPEHPQAGHSALV